MSTEFEFSNQPSPSQESILTPQKKKWGAFYRFAAIGAIAKVLIDIVDFGVAWFWKPLEFQPKLDNINGWFELSQHNQFLFLVRLHLLSIISEMFWIVLIIALYLSLRATSKRTVIIGSVLGVLGIVIYLAINPAIAMLSLANQYSAATTDSQRSLLVAAGQAVLTTYHKNAQHFLLTDISILLLAIAMLRSLDFGKIIAYTGIISSTFGIVWLLFPSAADLILWSISISFTWIFYILIARTFFRLR